MRFAHIADPQLGYVQYGLAARASDFNSAFIFCMDEALRRKVDAVVFSGDLFEMSKPAGTYVELVQEQVRRLRSAGMDVLGIEGNHDSSGGKWLSVCGIHDLEAYPYVCQGVGFAGLGYRRENAFLTDMALYAVEYKEKIEVLVLHQSLLNRVPFSMIKAEDIIGLLKPRGLRHLAMGHIHTAYSFVVDGVSVVCPGSTEMTDIDEPREKYMAITELAPGRGEAVTELVRIPTRPIMHYIVETEEELEKICSELPESRASILVAAVSAGLLDGQLRLTTAADKGGVPYRLTSFNPQAAVQRAALGEARWDRSHGVVDLTRYVDRSFPDSASDEHSLVGAMLAAPANCASVMKNYITEKLRELGYAE